MSDVPSDIENAHWDYGLFLIARQLSVSSRILAKYSLPEPVFEWERRAKNRFIRAEYAYDVAHKAAERDRIIPQFNDGQHSCFD